MLCAVPEKIRQLVQKKIVYLGNIRYIVVDEADNTIMNDKMETVMVLMKNLIETGNMNWKMIVCGATITMTDLKAKFYSHLSQVKGVKETPQFFDFKYYKYEIVLDNIYHYYRTSSKRSD